MKRKVALVICLVLVASLVMTVLVGCEGTIRLNMHDNSYSAIKHAYEYTLEESFNLDKNKTRKVEFSDSLISGPHCALVVSNKELASISVVCAGNKISVTKNVTGGYYWYGFEWNFDKYSTKSFWMSMSGVADVTLPTVEMEVKAKENNTKIEIAYQRVATEHYSTNKSRSKVWEITKVPYSVQASPDVPIPDGVYYLTKNDTKFLADVFNAVKGEFAKMAMKDTFQQAAEKTLEDIGELLDEGNITDEVAASFIYMGTTVFINGVNYFESAKSLKNMFEGIRKGLNLCVAAGTGCELRLYHQTLAGGKTEYSYSCEKYDINDYTYFYGVPGFEGRFR